MNTKTLIKHKTDTISIAINIPEQTFAPFEPATINFTCVNGSGSFHAPPSPRQPESSAMSDKVAKLSAIAARMISALASGFLRFRQTFRFPFARKLRCRIVQRVIPLTTRLWKFSLSMEIQ